MSTVLTHLEPKEQDNEFTVDEKRQVFLLGNCYQHQKIRLIRRCRFEGDADLEEEAIIYLIGVTDGTAVHSIGIYGISTNQPSDCYASLGKKIGSRHSLIPKM